MCLKYPKYSSNNLVSFSPDNTASSQATYPNCDILVIYYVSCFDADGVLYLRFNMNKAITGIILNLALIAGLLAIAVFGSCESTVTTEKFTILATETITTTIPTQTIMTAISREQAIALAAVEFPSSVILQSKITVQLLTSVNSGPDYLWDVSFDDFTITRDALIAFGWSVSDSHTSLLNYSEYHVADVNIDSQTGVIVWKGANAWRLYPPPLSTTTLGTT